MPRAAGAALRLLVVFLTFLLASPFALAADAILSSRVWPAQEYTRVTLEAPKAIKAPVFLCEGSRAPRRGPRGRGPQRRAEGPADEGGRERPYIQTVRVGRNRPNVVRIVFDLKTEVKPSVFPLAPAGEYKHRLVLDIYPLKPPDPLLALLQPKSDPIREIGEAPITQPPVEAAPPDLQS
jgi:N-acetylmuramoyl-L-alanine amidase